MNAAVVCGRAWGNVADVRRADIPWRFIYGERPLTVGYNPSKGFRLLTRELNLILQGQIQDVVSKINISTNM